MIKLLIDCIKSYSKCTRETFFTLGGCYVSKNALYQVVLMICGILKKLHMCRNQLKLIENFKQVWRESELNQLNVSIIEYLKQT